MSKEPIPNNFFLDAIKFLYRWGLRLIFLVVALILSFFLVFLIDKKYDSWAYEKVNLISLKCGPIIVILPSAHPELFISLRGTRKDKKFQSSSQLYRNACDKRRMAQYAQTTKSLSTVLVDLQTQRDEYIYERVFDDGRKLRVSLDRKTLRWSVSTTTGSIKRNLSAIVQKFQSGI